MSPRARVFRGVGREVNPLDGDQVVIELGVREGKIAYIGANTGAEARAHGGETFAGCETARRAALVLYKVFSGRELEESLTIGLSDLITEMDSPPDNERCVTTVLAAVRNALIDVQVTALAEAIVGVRRLRETG